MPMPRRDGRLRQVARFDHQVTGGCAAPDGRIFVNLPRWTDNAPISVAQLLPDDGDTLCFQALTGRTLCSVATAKLARDAAG